MIKTQSSLSHNKQTVIISENSVSELEMKLLKDGFKRLGKFSIGSNMTIDLDYDGLDIASAPPYKSFSERVLPIVRSKDFKKQLYRPGINYIVYGREVISSELVKGLYEHIYHIKKDDLVSRK